MIAKYVKLRTILFGGILLTMSCMTPSSGDPEVTFKTLEERLLSAQIVQMAFHVMAEGVLTVDIHGTLQADASSKLQLRGNGMFAGDSVDLLLRADVDEFEFGNGPDRKKDSKPRELRQAILIGLTRMGILHNLARLAGNAQPDHAEGGVQDWVLVDSFTVDHQHHSAISFAITVAGEPSGSATLDIGKDGQPVERLQTVRFPSGEMRVVERYSAVTIEP